MKQSFTTAKATRVLKRPIVILQLMLIMLMAASFQSFAGANAQTITLNAQNKQIAQVLETIEKQANFRFVYNSRLKDLKQKVSVNFNKSEINEALAQLFSGTALTYKVMQNNLIAIRAIEIADADIRVEGKVTSSSGAPVIGASVVVKGGTTGTYTDAQGNFSIQVADNATLVFSAVGYATQEVAVNGRTSVSVVLTQSVAQNLDEVVVIGYGTASKRDLTGSITKISGKEVADKPNTNPVASLQSKVTGLSVVNNGTPGAAPDIRIRGTVSIGQLRTLYVVDGILNDNIDYINPNDIESIEVLKDPSSLAIFGVRGATGVIAVTTKKGKSGLNINFNTTYGFKTLVDKIKMADAPLFDALFAEENANNGVATPDYSALKGNTDWIDAVTRKANYTATNLSVSNGTANNKFSFGLGYIEDQGLIIHEKQTKALLSFSDEAKLFNPLKLGVNLNVSRLQNPVVGGGALDQARKVMPQVSPGTQQFRVKDPYSPDSLDLNLYSGLNVALQNSGVVNPILEIENRYDKIINKEMRYVGSVYLDLTFLKDFNFRPTWYVDQSDIENRSYNPLYYAYNPMNNQPYLYSTRTSVYQGWTKYRKYQQDYILNYKHKFGDHNLAATGGFTTYYFSYATLNGTSVQGTSPTDLPIPNDPRLWYLNNGFGKVLESGAGSGQSENATVSYLARLIYNYKNKYYLNASYRDDASSRIPEKNRHQQFWSVGAAWEVGKESFMEDQKFFDYLKLKGSIGVLGNQSTYGVSGDYPSYPGLQSGTIVPFGTNVVTGALPAYRVNPNLQWETVDAAEVGVEFNAFQNRLHFEANYYNKVTKDMMTYVNLSSLGLDNQLENGGKIRNWGQEVMATWTQAVNKDLSINLSGNITFMKNKVLAVAESLPGGRIIDARANNATAEARSLPGYPIASFFGYVVEGLYQTQLDILNSPLASSLGTYRPGDFKFKDLNGDGVISADDRTIIGNPSPDFMYGGSVGLNYKGFNFDVDFGGVYGNEVFRVWGSLESPFQRVNYPAFKAERWNGPGTSNWEPIISQADRFNYNGSTYNIEDGSYFRIRNMQVGYNFGSKFSSAKIKNLRIFANAQNLKTWKHTKGYTAEYGGSGTAFGFDEGGGAIPRVITFGLNATF